MERKEIIKLMENVFTTSEAAEYLNISTQRLHQLVQDGSLTPIKSSKSATLFYKPDLDNRMLKNYANDHNSDDVEQFDINIPFVREAILYFTIQQYFNHSDNKTTKFIEEITNHLQFNMNEKLKTNIPILANHLKTSPQEFYEKYTKVKNSFQTLSSDVILLKKGDPIYSKLLENTKEAPPYLFLKGDLHLLNEKTVSIVGSRNASQKSLEQTERLAQSLIKRNIVISAGLAKGIDTAAHESALKHGGKTIAVIGTPINQYYPKENKRLQQDIEKNGLVISQFPPCNKTDRWHFPLRNATMSGISLATIIMEAGETSGALLQANYALKQQRDVLIPKSAIDNSLLKWPKKYVIKGAKPFSTLKEVLMILNENKALNQLFDDLSNEEIYDVEMD